MAAKRIAQSSIDWSKFASVVPNSERHLFNAFKAKSDAYLRRMLSYPEKAPEIDWSYYRKNISNKSVVDQLESAYKSLSITYPKDTLSNEIDAQEKAAEKDVEEFIENSKLIIIEANKMLDKFKLMIPVKDMTQEEFALTFPDWAVRQTVQPSWWPHEEISPGLTKEERKEIMKTDGPPYSLI